MENKFRRDTNGMINIETRLSESVEDTGKYVKKCKKCEERWV